MVTVTSGPNANCHDDAWQPAPPKRGVGWFQLPLPAPVLLYSKNRFAEFVQFAEQ